MRLRFTIILIFFLVSTFVRATEPSALKIGPDALDDYLGNGKWLIVMLWASDCVACNKEAYQYVEFHEFHHDIDARVLGISLDGSDQAAANRFIEKHNIPFPNLIADFTSASRWFNDLTGQQFWGTPGFLIYDPAGELRAQQIGAVPVSLIEDFIAKNSTAD